MNISDCMKRNVASITKEATVREVVKLVIKRHIGTLPVVDASSKLVGVIKLQKLLSIVMPDFVNLVEDFSFLHSFGAMENHLPESKELDCPIDQITEPPVWVEGNSNLLYASAIMHKHDLGDVPVVDENCHLIGIASHVDIGTALMQTWFTSPRSPDS